MSQPTGNLHAGRLAWRPVFATMLIASSSPVAGQECPFDRVVAQILNVDGRLAAVRLLRDGRRVVLKEHACILAGDLLDARAVASVRVTTVDGERRYGRAEKQATWIAPGPPPLPESSFRRRFGLAIDALIHPDLPPPLNVVGRGGGCEEESRFDAVARRRSPVIRPLRELASSRQRLDSSLADLVVAWKREASGDPTRIRLIRPDGRAIVETIACDGASLVEMALPPGVLHAGEPVRLEIGAGPSMLEYQIDVVAPGALAPVDTDGQPTWLRGAALLATGPQDTGLTALSWLATGRSTTYAAFAIVNAISNNETAP